MKVLAISLVLFLAACSSNPPATEHADVVRVESTETPLETQYVTAAEQLDFELCVGLFAFVMLQKQHLEAELEELPDNSPRAWAIQKALVVLDQQCAEMKTAITEDEKQGD